MVGVPGWILLVLEHPVPRRLALGSVALAIQIGVSAILVGFLVAVWAVTTGGYFWPIWPALGLALAAAVHAAVVYGRRAHRIEVLEASRAGAIDVQETELRRIERDLHDGAQARLVALGMSLGMAEQKLTTDPEAVRELLAEARRGAGEALEELRDLARGIHPPILTDRGLEAAVARAHRPQPGAGDAVGRRAPAACGSNRERGLLRRVGSARERDQARRRAARRDQDRAVRRRSSSPRSSTTAGAGRTRPGAD